MYTLRLHIGAATNRSARLDVSLYKRDVLFDEAQVTADLPSQERFQEDVRWYMEEFLDDAGGAAKVRAARVQGTIRSSGESLFRTVFSDQSGGGRIWRALRDGLRDARVEIQAIDPVTSAVPWEILQDPASQVPLALSARSFVWRRPGTDSGLLGRSSPHRSCRILLVISRPGGQGDIAYRTIASKLFASLNDNPIFEISVLRPPYFSEFARALRDARSDGRPFHLVHFDGHGLHSDSDAEGAEFQGPASEGGYILFEGEDAGSPRFVSAQEFSHLLDETGVAAVVLNACRSAYSARLPADSDRKRTPVVASFARELISTGDRIVVGMRYNVYVASAVRYVEELYRQLSRGEALTFAASLARKHMASEKRRPLDIDSEGIDDWLVPVIFQSGKDFSVRRDAPTAGTLRPPKTTKLIGVTPPPPDIGFVGSDDGLLAIDRSFEHSNVILLYGLAGAGKTAAAAEFCRWYMATNNSIENVLFTSFEQPQSLERAMAQLENLSPRGAFAQEWSRLSPKKRPQLAVSILRKAAALWVWDNVDTVGLLPPESREELAGFLKDAASAGVKFLLTARAPTQAWLGLTAAAVRMPPLRFSESSEFASRVIRRVGPPQTKTAAVTPILEFANGNPLTLSVALAAFLNSTRTPSAQAAKAFVNKLQAGGLPAEDDPYASRDRSLRLSLRYGFDRAFSRADLRVLSLLYEFRSYVNTWILVLMGRPPDDPGCVPNPVEKLIAHFS